MQPRALTQPLTSYLGGNNIHVRTPCACVLLRDRLYGFCFCSFPAFPMKSRRSIHGEGRSTARSPPTQEAEALEITLPKSTAETAAEEGYQWPAVGESKAHVYSPCGASMVLFEDPPPHIMSVDGVGLRVCPVAIVCYGRSHMRVSAVALQHRLTGIETLASPIYPVPSAPRAPLRNIPFFILWRITSHLSLGVSCPSSRCGWW